MIIFISINAITNFKSVEASAKASAAWAAAFPTIINHGHTICIVSSSGNDERQIRDYLNSCLSPAIANKIWIEAWTLLPLTAVKNKNLHIEHALSMMQEKQLIPNPAAEVILLVSHKKTDIEAARQKRYFAIEADTDNKHLAAVLATSERHGKRFAPPIAMDLVESEPHQKISAPPIEQYLIGQVLSQPLQELAVQLPSSVERPRHDYKTNSTRVFASYAELFPSFRGENGQPALPAPLPLKAIQNTYPPKLSQ